ncbi:hypothetical protein [Ascidiimonas aurantiaca]|uniref:hypothetical protein n=1 Tax=Ascidiimonas aurantiaca TaxID=1685432 RepID=UPI0030EE20B0
MKKICLACLLILCIGCTQDQKVQLAEVDQGEIRELTNHSAVYIFYDPTAPDSLIFNANNLITNTNWILHIDKRLPLSKLRNQLDFIYNKANKETMHKKEPSPIYFSVHDRLAEGLAFIEATGTKFQPASMNSLKHVATTPEEHSSRQVVHIDLNYEHQITIDGDIVKKEVFIPYLQEKLSSIDTSENILIYLNVDERIHFEEYINLYLRIKRLTSEKVQLAFLHFVY